MDQNPKQLIVEKLLSAKNVLVTVSKNPNVDQLASAVGMTLMQNALDSRAVAVFSGEVPNALEFLNPEKNFDKTVDSLRDFIISIDKDKADKLRYKVEGDVVRIFITPYKTVISDKDLEFSQGDFNVDVVLALGVTNRGDLDQAIVSHGRILHDATIASITVGGESGGDLGAINWHEPDASSIAEMLVSMSEALQNGILDQAMSTAFLTGIVSATERFSNDKTTPKVMTMSAQLMAAGADQQLISKNLRMDRGRTKDLLAKPDDGELAEGQVLEVNAGPDLTPTDNINIEEVKKQLQKDIKSTPPATDQAETQEKAPAIVKDHQVQPLSQRHMAGSDASNKGLHDHSRQPHKPVAFSATEENAREAHQDALQLASPAEQTAHPADPRNPTFAPDIEMPPAVDENLVSARADVTSALNAAEFVPAHNPTVSLGAQHMEVDEPDNQEITIDASGQMKVNETTAVPQPGAPMVPPPLPPKPHLPQPPPPAPVDPSKQPENPLFQQQK